MNNLRVRVCKQCGQKFDGGPRAWYCPECRYYRREEQSKRYKQNKRLGKSAVIGKTVRICTVCGNKFVIASANQKYCKGCAPEAIKQKDAEQGAAYYHRMASSEYRAKRSKLRREHYAKNKEEINKKRRATRVKKKRESKV